MIKIQTEGLGKRFNREWIFRALNLQLQTRESWAITGPNGSGKSTLLQSLIGYTIPSEGKLNYFFEESKISADQFYLHLSLVAPYQELIEELTLTEGLEFHFQFKKARNGFDIETMIQAMYLENARHKYIKHFSSGMKQRLKLGLAFFSDTPALFLDEPTNNLDHKAIDWYQMQLEQIITDRLVVICSNQPYEYELCQNKLDISDHKPSTANPKVSNKKNKKYYTK